MPASASSVRSMAAMSSRSSSWPRPDGTLHPVQQAMVDTHASQCGFCTPGFVMSLYGLWMQDPKPIDPGNREGAAGQSLPLHRLCGDHPRRARPFPLSAIWTRIRWSPNAQAITEQLQALKDGKRVEIGEGKQRLIAARQSSMISPKSTRPIPSATHRCRLDRCRALGDEVHARDRAGRLPRRISMSCGRSPKSDGGMTLGAGVSYTEAYPLIVAHFPQLDGTLEPHRRRAGAQHGHGRRQHRQRLADRRHAAGLIALGATVSCARARAARRCRSRTTSSTMASRTGSPANSSRRSHIPFLGERRRFSPSTRSPSGWTRTFPPSAAHSDLTLDERRQGRATSVIAFGGMAGNAEARRGGRSGADRQPWNEATIEAAVAAFAEDFTPLTDLARLGRLPPAGGEEPAAALLS